MDKKMEFTDVKETVKCFCHKLRNRPLKSVHAHKTARGNVCYIFIFLTLVILLLCVIVYVICTVQKLTAKYEESLHTINFLRNDIYSLKQKYRQLDRLKTSTKMISANAGDIEVGANGFKEVNHLPAEFTEVRTDRKSASSLQETKPEPLIRKKRAKKQRKKKCRDSRKDIARLQGVVDDLLEAREIDRVNLENEILTKLRANQDKAGQRVRRSRHCRVPHFFLHGHNESTLRKDHISETGVFLWRNRDVSTDYFRVQQSHSANTPYLDGIQIKQAGTYFIFAKVHVRGRKDARRAPDPAVGLSLKLMPGLSREGAVSRYLDNVFITQDDRGRNYPGFGSPKRYPVDVLELSGIYYLEREDTIYISRPRNDESNSNIMYDNRFGFAHFGGYMVEFESCHT